MSVYKNDLIRMELQLGQLIRIVANMNERILELENKLNDNQIVFMKSVSKKKITEEKTPGIPEVH